MKLSKSYSLESFVLQQDASRTLGPWSRHQRGKLMPLLHSGAAFSFFPSVAFILGEDSYSLSSANMSTNLDKA